MEITTKQIDEIWDGQSGDRQKLKKRRDYFNGKHSISTRTETFANGDKKTNTVTNFAEYVVDMYVGSLTSTDYQLTSNKEGAAGAANYGIIADALDLPAIDVNNLSNALVYGRALELHEFTEKAPVITAQRPEKWALTRDESGSVVLAINRVTLGKNSFYDGALLTVPKELQHVYSEQSITVHARDVVEGAGTQGTKGKWVEISNTQHNYGQVPIVEWIPDVDQRGLLTDALIGQIDDYNEIDSLGGDDIRQTADALLKIKGVGGAWAAENADTITKMRMLPMPEDSDAEYLTKVTDVARVESHLARSREAVHLMTGVPDVQQIVGATGGTSGIALQLKFTPMQNRAGAMIKELTKGMRARIDLLNGIARKMGGTVIEDYNVIMTFSIPVNRIEEWMNIGALNGIVTQRTQLELLTDINDPEKELKALQDESVVRAETEGINEDPATSAARQDLAVQKAGNDFGPSIDKAMELIGDRLLNRVNRGLNATTD